MNSYFHNPKSCITLEKSVKFWVTLLSSPQAHINWVSGFDPKDLKVRNIPLPNLDMKIASLPSVLRVGIYAFLIASKPLRLLRDSFLPSRVIPNKLRCSMKRPTCEGVSQDVVLCEASRKRPGQYLSTFLLSLFGLVNRFRDSLDWWNVLNYSQRLSTLQKTLEL